VATFTLRQGDTRTAIKATLLDSSGQPVNLTGATVSFLMGRNGTQVINRYATIHDAVNGVVWSVWNPGETDVPGFYHAEFKVTFSDGSVESYPNSGSIKVIIEPDVTR
jgi:hypothetical protein